MISHGFGPFHGPSPWIDKPVLSTIRWRGCLEEPLRFNIGFKDLLLLDNVVWSGIGSHTFIISNNDVTNPSVCLNGRWKWNNNLNVRMVSIAKSAYFCCLNFLISTTWWFLETGMFTECERMGGMSREENYRYKTMIGRRLRARTELEAKINCNLLNQFLEVGMATSERVT